MGSEMERESKRERRRPVLSVKEGGEPWIPASVSIPHEGGKDIQGFLLSKHNHSLCLGPV